MNWPGDLPVWENKTHLKTDLGLDKKIIMGKSEEKLGKEYGLACLNKVFSIIWPNEIFLTHHD